MKSIAYQLIIDFNQSNLKTLSREILYFIKRLTVICDDDSEIIRTIHKLEELEARILYSSKELKEGYEYLGQLIKPKNASEPRPQGYNNFSDVTMLVKLLRNSASYIFHDLIKDRLALLKVRPPVLVKDNPEKLAKTEDYIYKFKEFSYNINYFNQRAEIYLSSLSDLKSRLEQSIDLHSRDILKSDPNRRILENVTDSFVTHVASRCYRDLYDFLCTFNDSQYPYSSLPIIYQYQNNSQSSKIVGFNSDEGYKEWIKGFTESEGYRVNSSGYSVMQLSYWLQERSLIPIVGHEVAHRVLRNVGSRTLLPQILALTGHVGNLGHFIRGVSRVYREIAKQNGIREFHKLELELMCDLLATTRFGYSFLYCWFLKGFSTDAYANQIVDDFGRLDKALIQTNCKKDIYDPHYEVFQRYIFGKIIIFWLKVMNTETDSASQQLAEAVNEHLDLLLLSTYSKNIVTVAVYIVKKIRRLVAVWNKKSPISNLRIGFQQSNKQNPHHFWMNIQSISEPLKSLINEKLIREMNSELNDCSSEVVNIHNRVITKLRSSSGLNGNPNDPDDCGFSSSVKAVSDVPWRIEWKLSSIRFLNSFDGEGNDNLSKKLSDDFTIRVQEKSKNVMRLLIEDYVFNTRNILSVLATKVIDSTTYHQVFCDNLAIYWADLTVNSDLHKRLLEFASLEPDKVREIKPLDVSDDYNPFRLKVRNLSIRNPQGIISVLRVLLQRFEKSLEGASYYNHISYSLLNKSEHQQIAMKLLEEIDDYYLDVSTPTESDFNSESFWLRGVSAELNMDFSNTYIIELGVIDISGMNELGNFDDYMDKNSISAAGEFSGLILGEFDYFEIIKAESRRNFSFEKSSPIRLKTEKGWLMHNNSRAAIMTYNSLPEGFSASLLVRVSLFKADYRVIFQKLLTEKIEYFGVRACTFLSFGSEDAIILINIQSCSELLELNKFLADVYDSPFVGRTERFYTDVFFRHMLETCINSSLPENTYQDHISCAFKIKLNPEPTVKLSTVLERMSELISSDKYSIDLDRADFQITNGNLDISIPMKLTNKNSLVIKDLILKDRELSRSIQRFYTELRFKNIYG